MRERPIIFSGDMVRAILKGRKTQTRRVVKPQPAHAQTLRDGRHETSPDGGFDHGVEYITCPYGRPGDLLWVRETFQIEDASEYGLENADPPEGPVRIEHGGPDWGDIPLIPRYRATQPDTLLMIDADELGEPIMRWRPSIHMPKWAARIWLRVKDVRVERLEEISEEDVYAEGIERRTHGTEWGDEHAFEDFVNLWESINGDKPGASWDANPWVWVVEFERTEAPAQ